MSEESTQRFGFSTRPHLTYMMLAGQSCLQLLLHQLHSNNTEFVWLGGVASYQLLGHSQLMLRLSWTVTKRNVLQSNLVQQTRNRRKYYLTIIRITYDSIFSLSLSLFAQNGLPNILHATLNHTKKIQAKIFNHVHWVMCERVCIQEQSFFLYTVTR